MNIDIWLAQFKKYWVGHDIQRVIKLFTSDVEYFETPFHKLNNTDELTRAWSAISQQEDIHLDLTVFNKQGNTFSVIWKLEYVHLGIKKSCAGTYLIKLNNANLCTYFFHCCECK